MVWNADTQSQLRDELWSAVDEQWRAVREIWGTIIHLDIVGGDEDHDGFGKSSAVRVSSLGWVHSAFYLFVLHTMTEPASPSVTWRRITLYWIRRTAFYCRQDVMECFCRWLVFLLKGSDEPVMSYYVSSVCNPNTRVSAQMWQSTI